MVWAEGMVSLLMAVLWVANMVVDIVTIWELWILSVGDGIFMIIVFIHLHIIIGGWLIKVLASKFNKVGLCLLFFTAQAPLFILGQGAWHGLRACCVQSQREKKRRTFKAKFSLVCEVRSSFERVPVEGSEYSLRSCVLSQSEVVTAETTETPLTYKAFNIMCDVENGTGISVEMMKTKFVQNTNQILLNLDTPPDVYAGESSVYKYIVEKLRALFGDKKNLSYHIVTDSTSTKILHASCTDKRIGSLPNRILGENPRVICSDIHYILNLYRVNGYEVYDITKRSFGEVTCFVNRDLTKLIWLPTWPLTVVKMLIIMALEVHLQVKSGLAIVSAVFGIMTWLVTQKSLYHTSSDTFFLAGLRLFFYVARTILVIGAGVLFTLILIPIIYLSAKAAGIVVFLCYLAYMKWHRNLELFNDVIDMYTFYSMHDPVVQVAESIVYCLWAVCMYCNYDESHVYFGLVIMLISIIGQIIGLVWLWFMRSWHRQPLRDPVQVLTLIKQMEYARM